MNSLIPVTGNCNVARFIPGRMPRLRSDGKTDDRKMLASARYGHFVVENTALGFEAGVAIGPELNEQSLLEGGKVVPAIAEIRDGRPTSIKIRQFDYEDAGQKHSKKYIDFASFKAGAGGTLNAVPIEEDDAVYVETWTGHWLSEDAALQLIQAGLFQHGSVEHHGEGTLLLNQGSKRKAKKAGEGGMSSNATLVAEKIGPSVAGIPLWIARLWKLRFSGVHCETILVRQFNDFYVVGVNNRRPAWQQVPPENVKKAEKLFIDNSAKIEQAVAA